MLTLLSMTVLPLVFYIQPVEAEPGIIYIRADGSIDPYTVPILRDGNLYTFTGNITSDTDCIRIERDNIVVDGTGYTLQFTGLDPEDDTGIYLFERNYVTLRNIVFEFPYGIHLNCSSNCIVSDNVFLHSVEAIFVEGGSGNDILNNVVGGPSPNDPCIVDGIHLRNSSNNVVSGNNLTGRCHNALSMVYAHSNYIAFNHMTNHFSSGPFNMFRSHNNVIVGNTIHMGVHLYPWHISFQHSNGNVLYHNNFRGKYMSPNTISIDGTSMNTVWDNGYPSGGNYWSNYTGVDNCNGPFQNWTGSDGIGDTPHTIDANNIDRYPLMYVGVFHQLTVTSSPLTGVQFTINGAPKTTPYTESLLAGSYTLEMKPTYEEYIWHQWLEDGDMNNTRIVTVDGNLTFTASYTPGPTPTVGGIYTPTNKLSLLAPYVGLTILLAVAAVTVAYVKKRKRNRD